VGTTGSGSLGCDFPNDKATVEMLITVPAGWEAVSNGKLVSITKDKTDDSETFHWVQGKPMSSYLISLVAGEFDKREEAWKVPLLFYVPRGRVADVPRTFGRTAKMLDFFSSRIGPYPWAKYSQAAVDTFNGGMENTSATTIGADMLLRAEEFEDDRPATDADIAHEMAHQWFGDLITCADWRQSWLNEGFATYFEALWEEHSEGREYFDWMEERAARKIASRDSTATVVPAAGTDQDSAYSLINDKGSWILQMARGELGDANFWKAIQYYTRKFSYKTATTSDFVDAISVSTGENLKWLFDQYLYEPGSPKLDVAWGYDSTQGRVHVAVKQTQTGDGIPQVFHVPLEFEVLGDSEPKTFHVWLTKRSEDFYFTVSDRPRTILLDPRDIVLKSVTFAKPDAEWIWQLKNAPSALNRSEAAVELGSFNTPGAIEALTQAGVSSAFFGIRLDSVESLTRIASEATREPLTKMLDDKDLRVRRASASALGHLPRNGDSMARLLELTRNDPSYSVRQSALRAVVLIKPENVIALVMPFLDSQFADQRLRPTAIAALARLGDESVVPRLLGLTHDSNDRVRHTALQAFGELGKGQQLVLDRLLEALNDDDKVDRLTAIAVLAKRKEESARGPLQHLAETEALPGVAHAARLALASIPSASGRK
jgi:aminopeptidase N